MVRKLMGCAIGLAFLLGPLSAWARPLFYVNGCAAKLRGSNQTAQSHSTGFDLGVGYGIRISPRLELRPMVNYMRLPLDSKWAAEQISASHFYIGVTGGALNPSGQTSVSGILHLKLRRNHACCHRVFANVDDVRLSYDYCSYSVTRSGSGR